MLLESSFEASGSGEVRIARRPRVQCADDSRCEQIHQRLRRIAKARGALDVQEAEALREADAACVWRRYGYSSLLEYMEAELGYTPRVAIERLRVAKAIVELPMIGEAMLQAELSFSAARELTRVATAETEGEWLEASRELNLRELEERVAGHKRGDRPTDEPDPGLRMKTLRTSVRPETYALMRQAQQILGRERGERLDEDAYLAATARMVIDGHRPHACQAGGDSGSVDGTSSTGERPAAFSFRQMSTSARSFGISCISPKIEGTNASTPCVRGCLTVSDRKQQSGQASSTLSTTPRSVVSRRARACFSSAVN